MLLVSDIPHFGQLQEDQCWIYALVDPRSDEVRYIGCSNKVTERARTHISGFSCINGISEWVCGLRKGGLKPRVFLLQPVDAERRNEAEIYWIQECVNRGANLINTIHKPRAVKGRA